jgi:predicted nucleic acid-binding protein
MRKLSIYLDTSIINFLFADDAPELRDITILFFSSIVRKGIYDIWISSVVVDEIQQTADEAKRERLLNAVRDYDLPILDTTSSKQEIRDLANKYIESKAIPPGKEEEALHVAISTVFEIDVLLSWNYRHLANLSRERRIMLVNLSEGYAKPLRIITPMEVITDEE